MFAIRAVQMGSTCGFHEDKSLFLKLQQDLADSRG
jgi:hypothetical protein